MVAVGCRIADLPMAHIALVPEINTSRLPKNVEAFDLRFRNLTRNFQLENEPRQ